MNKECENCGANEGTKHAPWCPNVMMQMGQAEAPPASTEVTVAEVAALLKGIMATTTVMMECMAHQTTRIEKIEAQLKTMVIVEDPSAVKMLGFDPPLDADELENELAGIARETK